MAYYKTKKALKGAFEEWKRLGGDDHRADLQVYQPGPFGPHVKDGRTALEGPHYPKPHRWYADVEVKNGHIVKIYG